MAGVPYATSSAWSWPDELNRRGAVEEDMNLPESFAYEEPEKQEQEPATEQQQSTNGPANPRRPQRVYPPRVCRICLEVINPTVNLDPGVIPSMFSPAPKVEYISEDPESGRLIRPCLCSGSGKYVHENCLKQWRHVDKTYRQKNYWECPTCKFKYHLERLKWSRWIGSTFVQLGLTVVIMFVAIFLFGFIADPIINLYLDPFDTIKSIPSGGLVELSLDDEETSWAEHFLKGIASLGLLGFIKAFLAMSPWHWLNLRQSGALGGGRGGRRGTGRERLAGISWSLVLIGVATFLYAVWTFVRSWSRRTLEMASERVVDVQGDDDDFEEVPPPADEAPNPESATSESSTAEAATTGAPESESRKTQ